MLVNQSTINNDFVSDNRQILGDIDGIDVILQQLAVSRNLASGGVYQTANNCI